MYIYTEHIYIYRTYIYILCMVNVYTVNIYIYTDKLGECILSTVNIFFGCLEGHTDNVLLPIADDLTMTSKNHRLHTQDA